MKKNFSYTLGSNIRAERLRKHHTQDELAELIDMSVNYIGKIERGVTIPSSYVLFRIASVLKIPIDELFKDIEK